MLINGFNETCPGTNIHIRKILDNQDRKKSAGGNGASVEDLP
jgi:hypothetical protein